jgi:hypothetical protein
MQCGKSFLCQVIQGAACTSMSLSGQFAKSVIRSVVKEVRSDLPRLTAHSFLGDYCRLTGRVLPIIAARTKTS